MKLNDNVEKILYELNKKGQGFIVGGSLRDMALGKVPKDFDFTTNLDYDTVADIFKDYKTKEVGKVFGIIVVKMDDENYEIARFRKDVNAQNHYNTEVEFVDNIEEDLMRRDFTFNAMAYNHERGIIDLYGGIEDLEKRQINFIGNPEERIKEDGLRILRAFRFMSVLDFELSAATEKAISENRDELKTISFERIGMEFNKILAGKNVKNTLQAMKETGTLEIIIPEIKATYEFNQHNPHHEKDLWEHTVEVVSAVPCDLNLRYAALLHDISKPETQTFDEKGIAHYLGHEMAGAEKSEEILRKLRQKRTTINEVKSLISNHMLLHNDLSSKTMAKHIRKIGSETFEKLIQLNLADDEGKGTKEDKSSKIYRKFNVALEIANPGLRVDNIALNGNEISKLGYAGKKIGEVKEKLLRMILDGEVLNEKNSLLKVVKNFQKIR